MYSPWDNCLCFFHFETMVSDIATLTQSPTQTLFHVPRRKHAHHEWCVVQLVLESITFRPSHPCLAGAVAQEHCHRKSACSVGVDADSALLSDLGTAAAVGKEMLACVCHNTSGPSYST